MRPSLRSCPAPARPGSSRGGGREAGGSALEGAPALRLGAWGPWGQGWGRGTVPQGPVSGLEKHHREVRGGTGARSPRHARAGVSPLELLPKKAAQQLRPPWYRKHVPGGARPWPAGGPEGEPRCEWGVTPESWDTGGPCVDGQRPLPKPHTQRPCAHLSPSRSPLRRAWLARASESQRPGATRWASEPPGSPGAGRAVGCRAGDRAPSAAVAPASCPPTGSPEARWAQLWEMARGSTTPTAEGRRLTGRRLKPNVPSCGSRPGQGASRRTRTGTPARRARGSLSCSPDSAPAHSQTALPGSRPRPWGPLGLSPQKREFSFLILEALDGPLPTQGPSSPALPGPRGACPPGLWL